MIDSSFFFQCEGNEILLHLFLYMTCPDFTEGDKKEPGEVESRVARWLIFKPKRTIWVNFGLP
jgi:hypothetical protein